MATAFSQITGSNTNNPIFPLAGARPQARIFFDIPGLAGQDFGELLSRIEIKGSLNAGYVIRARLYDTNYGVLGKLTDSAYLFDARTAKIKILVQLQWDDAAFAPPQATPLLVGYVTALQAVGGAADMAMLDFIAVDPANFWLSTGDASGGAYVGNLSAVIRQVVTKYGNGLNLIIDDTTDSQYGIWHQFRLDPRTYISSLLSWSSSITKSRTQWIVQPDGTDDVERLLIQEQANINSQLVGHYTYWADIGHDTILGWQILTDNALSQTQTKIVTAGASALTGTYLDRVTDLAETQVFAKDATTPNKLIPNTTAQQSFTAPPDGGPPVVGWTAVPSIPEFSDGFLGIPYQNYIDGIARSTYLTLNQRLMRMRITVLGHGSYYSCAGLGVNTAFLDWKEAGASDNPSRSFFASGYWIVYGWSHKLSRKIWTTDVYLARTDFDQTAKSVPQNLP